MIAMRRGRARRATVMAVAAVVLALAAGCTGIPTVGPVVPVGSGGQGDQAPGVAIDPRPPRAGMGPTEIVDGFLEAMLAAPTQTQTARKFLTDEAQDQWKPAHEIRIYSGRDAAVAHGDEVEIRLGDTWRVDAQGAWLGAGSDADRTLRFPVVRSGDEWRISAVPDALIVPDWWFEGRYSQVSLYYFNATETRLVPEPVFVPRGREFASTVVRALVHGPGVANAGVVHSAIPADVTDGLSVPIDDRGVADIALKAREGQQPLTTDQIGLLTAELAWTLRQDASITSVRLSIGGVPVVQPNGRAEFPVADAGPQFDPAGYQSNPLVFGLREGRIVAGALPSLEPTRGQLGTTSHRIRSIGVDLRGVTVAAVSTSGRSLMLSSTSDPTVPISTLQRNARDLLKPAWDGDGRVWLVDRRSSGAVVSALRPDGSGGWITSAVEIAGISGSQVRAFQISRDGTRFVAVVRRDGAETVVVSRIATATDGEPFAAGPLEVIGAGLGPITDIAWTSPATITVLHGSGDEVRVTGLSVDGASLGLQPGGVLVGRELSGLIGSPVPGQPAYGLDGRRLVSLSAVGRDQIVPETVGALTYAG